MPVPSYIRLVVPADKITGSTIHSPAGDYEVDDAMVLLRSIAYRFNQWIKQSGYHLQLNTGVVVSPLTLAELQTNNDTTSAADDLGEGLSNDRLTDWAYADPIVLDAANNSYIHFRIASIVVGGGGYAGGFCTLIDSQAAPSHNRGFATIGDVQFSPSLTGAQDPWSIDHGLPDDGKAPGRAFSHEMLHHHGLYCHAGDDFSAGEFAVPGFWQPINGGFAVYPLGGVLPPPDGQPALEQMLYPGHIAQLLRFSGAHLSEAL